MNDSELTQRLQLSKEQMQALGYRIVDLLTDHFERLSNIPVAGKGSRPLLESRLREPLPERPGDFEQALLKLERDVFPFMLHVGHPRFFAFVPSPSNFVSAMADALAAGINPFVGTWLGGSGPAQVELVVIDWLREICGLPADAGGLLVSGGSMANLTALAAARHAKLGENPGGGVIYFSDQTHASVEKGLRVLGFRADQIRKLPSERDYRLSPQVLEREIAVDRASGRTPFCLVANAGTTSTGAVDPLPALANICAKEDLWLHADGAYGAAAALCEKGRGALAGLEGVDSLSLDPHKWLFQPFEVGCVLLRDGARLTDTFRTRPEYLRDAAPAEDEVNLSDRGVQLTRGFRALKLWMSFKVFGVEAFRRAVAWGIEQAEIAEVRLRESPLWEIVTPAQLGVVTFRSKRGGDGIQEKLIGRLAADGFAFLSSTELRGRTALRLCTINPRTTAQDIRETIDRLERFVREDEA